MSKSNLTEKQIKQLYEISILLQPDENEIRDFQDFCWFDNKTKVYNTNAIMLCFIEADYFNKSGLIANIPERKNMQRSTLKYYNRIKKSKEKVKVSINKLSDQILMFDDHFSTVTEVEKYDCPNCEGDSEVVYVHKDHESEDHEINLPCPVCDGRGFLKKTISVVDKSQVNPKALLLILDQEYKANFIVKILSILSKTVDNIFLSQDEDQNLIIESKDIDFIVCKVLGGNKPYNQYELEIK